MQDTLPTMCRVSHAGVATYLPGATFGPRSMRDYEFVWMVEGDATYRWNAEEFAAPEGSIVLCRPGGEDFFTWDRTRRTRHAYFHFDLRGIPADWPAIATWPFVRRPREGDILRPAFGYMLTWSGRGSEALVRLTALQMVAAFVLEQFDSGGIPRGSLPEPVAGALQFIRRTLDRDMSAGISLGDLAGAAGVSEEHLCRLFRASVGHSPSETVRMARLDRAMILLARSNYSIGEVATMCGFASQFHFSRRFGDAFGMPPRTMRKRLEQGRTPPTLLVDNWSRPELPGPSGQ